MKILILVVFSLLSKIQAQDYETCDCPEDKDCNFDDSCECLKGFEGNDCEINICTLPYAYHCEANSDICIKPENICDGNPDCPDWAEDEKICPDTGKCIGPIKWCDGNKDCDNNEDESECCNDYPPEQGPLDCKEGTMPDECRANVCVPKCDGKNDTCAKLHGLSALDTYCVEYSDLDEQNCLTSCPQGEIQCFSSNKNSALPLMCKKPETKCDGVRDCETFGEDEKDCPTECPEEQYQCSEPVAPLYRECISADLIGNAVKDCADGSDEKAIRCNEHACTCSDKDDFFLKCLDNEEEECPNPETDIKSCKDGFWWWWIIVVVLILLLILALLIWYCCKNRKKPDPIKPPLSNQDAGSEETQPINQPDQLRP